MTDNLPTFDVELALEYARKRKEIGLSDNDRIMWKESLKELRDDIPKQLKRTVFSPLSMSNII